MFNAALEAISPRDQRRLETERLRAQMQYVVEHSPFYQTKFASSGFAARTIKDIEDLSQLPFTTKQELRQSQKAEPPFGDYLAAPSEKIRRVHRTSGTTGRFLFTALTTADLDLTHDCGARAFWSAGLRPHHRVVHCLNYCLWMGGYTDHANLETTGATVFPFGVGNSRQLVRVIRDAEITAISSTPSYPQRLEKVVSEELDMEPADLGLELGLFGGEPGMENPDFRQRLEAVWGMQARNANYGVSDVLCNFAAVCEENDKLHFLGQGALLLQLINPETLADIPMEDGAVGEMVLTHLQKEAQPLIRYRTADVIEILETDPCRCGRTGFRFRVRGRADDMLHVKGINVFPGGVAMVLEKMVPDVTGEFQIIVDHPPPHTSLHIKIEHGPDIQPDQIQGLQTRIENSIKATFNFKAHVKIVAPESIQRTAMGKARRVIKSYRSSE